MRLRTLIVNLELVCVSIVLAVAAVEAALRFSESRWELDRRAIAAGTPSVRYQHEPGGHYWLKPSQSTTVKGACYSSSPVSVSEGVFRLVHGSEGSTDIQVMGDSFIEDLQVPDGQTFADHLSARSGQSVLNAGVSGYATTHELAAWRSRLFKQHPKLVVLAIYLGNGINCNACA